MKRTQRADEAPPLVIPKGSPFAPPPPGYRHNPAIEEKGLGGGTPSWVGVLIFVGGMLAIVLAVATR